MITREFRSVSSRPAVIVFKRCKVLTENKVRPKTYLAEDTLICLRETGYKWKDIAAMFMVSRWTLFQQAKELGLESITGFNNISDEELDLKMRDFKDLHGPAVGRSLAMGYLRECGLRGQQEWVAKALVRVEPENSPLRWAALIRRCCSPFCTNIIISPMISPLSVCYYISSYISGKQLTGYF